MHTPSSTGSVTELDLALARLDRWMDSSVATRSGPPEVLVPQLPVPELADVEHHGASTILIGALISGATTATTVAVLVLAAMALLPGPPRPGFVP